MSQSLQKPVIDNATIGRLETIVKSFDELTPEQQNTAYITGNLVREARDNLKRTSAAGETTYGEMVAARRNMLETRHALENGINVLENKEELRDKLQDAVTYAAAAVPLAVGATAGAVPALVVGGAATVVSWLNDSMRAESREPGWGGINDNDALEFATKAGDIVGVGADAVEAAGAATKALKFGGPVFGVVGGGVDAAQAFTNAPTLMQVPDISTTLTGTSSSFDALRSSINQQSGIAGLLGDKSEVTALANKAEAAQSTYIQKVRAYNQALRAYVQALRIAKTLEKTTFSAPR